jgi:hypothetical protein
MDIYGAHTAERVRFHILVQQFIGIQFWTVGRQKENLDLLTVLGQPTTHQTRLVYRVPIHNEKYLSPGLARQAQETAKKIQEHPCRETLPADRFPIPPASVRAVRRSAPLDGLSAAPSRLTNEFAPSTGAPVLESRD